MLRRKMRDADCCFGYGSCIASTENYLPQAWTRRASTMKATSLRSATNTRLGGKRMIYLEVQLKQRIAKPSFLIVTSPAPDMILGTAYINEDIEEIIPEESTLKPAGLILVAIEKSVSNTTYLINDVKPGQSRFEDEFNKYPCTAVCHRIILSTSELYLHATSNTQGVRLVTTHENLVQNRQALVAQGIVKIVST